MPDKPMNTEAHTLIDRASHDRLRRLATYASVAVALTLIVVKAYAFLSSNSIGVLVSLLDSVLDLVASAVIMIGVLYAQ